MIASSVLTFSSSFVRGKCERNVFSERLGRRQGRNKCDETKHERDTRRSKFPTDKEYCFLIRYIHTVSYHVEIDCKETIS